MAPGHDVLERGHVEKDLQVLERAPDAGSGEFVRRRAGKVALAEDDAARARHIDAGQEVEQGRLARAIGADDRMNRSGSGLPREIIDGAHSAEFLRQPLDAQRAHWAPTLAASLANSAAALPPEGEQFAPWGGPAALIPALTIRSARFAPWRRRLDFFQRVAKIGRVLEAAVDGGEADVRDLVELVELAHHHFADLARWNFALAQAQYLLHDALDRMVDVLG